MTKLTFTRELTIDPDRAYRAWTDSDLLAKWWWPQVPDVVYSLDPKVGGAYEIASETQGFGARGEYLELTPPSKLRFTWVWLPEGDHTPMTPDEVTVTITAEGTGSKVVVTHDSTEDLSDPIEEGWNDTLDRLAELR